MNQDSQAYQNLVADLSQIGLNLVAAFDLKNLPEIVRHSLPDQADQLFASILLVGTKGSQFWNYLKRLDKTEGDCFDQQSQQLTVEMLTKHYTGVQYKMLYPSNEYVLPLQQLGHSVGWGRPSILGPGIHPEYGTWFAYRTAMLVSEFLPVTPASQAEQVCEKCIDKPCQSACPARAVGELDGFKLNACMSYRLEEISPCADRCLARLACPVGKDYFYQPDHLAHHSKFSLASIKRYRDRIK